MPTTLPIPIQTHRPRVTIAEAVELLVYVRLMRAAGVLLDRVRALDGWAGRRAARIIVRIEERAR